ncbi:MAG: hypothetical protein LBR85_02180 [Oscillospiraceae bacterium]|jgi:hypothetical protein|nr:hypothetical protein [Oscillospiraceae bacterium]
MTYENWIQLLVPAVGIAVAIVSASFSYFFARKRQILSDECRIKEEYYLNYIKAVSNSVVTNSSEKARDQLADAQNQLLLIGSADVVANLMIFHDFLKPSNRNEFDPNMHDELLTQLLKSMRSDLYKNKKVNDGYPIIHLTGKSPRK